jgi:hypothetical protein
MAIAALTLATPLGPARYGRAFWLAARFAAGHALLLSTGAAAVLLFGWQVPAQFEHIGEFMGGCVLIVMGLVGCWLAYSGRVYAHAHIHDHGATATAHRHWHLHVGRAHSHQPGIHTALPGIMGAVFAVSGLRALILTLPLWNADHQAGTLLLLVTLFALGILASMSLFGIVLAHALDLNRMNRQVARCAAAITAISSLALGVYWIQ